MLVDLGGAGRVLNIGAPVFQAGLCAVFNLGETALEILIRMQKN